MNRDDRTVFLQAGLIALFVVLAAAAFASDAPPVDCVAVRAHVSEHGRAKAVNWALSQGYTWADILRVKKQCGV